VVRGTYERVQIDWLVAMATFWRTFHHDGKITMNLGSTVVRGTDERVQIDWQWSFSGLHSQMIVNLAQPGVGGGARPPPLDSIYHPVVVLYTPAEWADTLLLFLLYPFLLYGER
jgi:hypothetical protein